jgi:ribosomal protein S18 acetylase RimI-like enzyme
VTATTDVVVREAQPGELHLCELMATEVASAQSAAAPQAADIVFVAEAGRHLAGFAAVRRSGRMLRIEQLVVAVTDEGRGVGNRLLDWVEGYGVSQGLERVQIAVEEGNRTALDFYIRRGYLPAGGKAVERELTHF